MADCNHDWVEVITYKEIYRQCVTCTVKEIKDDNDEWG